MKYALLVTAVLLAIAAWLMGLIGAVGIFMAGVTLSPGMCPSEEEVASQEFIARLHVAGSLLGIAVSQTIVWFAYRGESLAKGSKRRMAAPNPPPLHCASTSSTGTAR